MLPFVESAPLHEVAGNSKSTQNLLGRHDPDTCRSEDLTDRDSLKRMVSRNSSTMLVREVEVD